MTRGQGNTPERVRRLFELLGLLRLKDATVPKTPRSPRAPHLPFFCLNRYAVSHTAPRRSSSLTLPYART